MLMLGQHAIDIKWINSLLPGMRCQYVADENFNNIFLNENIELKQNLSWIFLKEVFSWSLIVGLDTGLAPNWCQSII